MSRTPENTENRQAPAEETADLFAFLRPMAEVEIDAISRLPELPLRESAALGRELLLGRLRALAEPTVQAALEETLCRINPAVQLSPHFASDSDRAEARAETLQRLSAPGGSPFERYPLLRQDAERVSANFRAFFTTFLRQVSAHAGQIEQELLAGRSMGRLLSLGASGADMHLHGQCAMRVVCEGGVFYYKPRDSRLDLLYRQIVARFCPDETLAPRVVCADGFGFLECMQTLPVESTAELAQYYRNFGALTALFRFLGSSDMHFENILACGVYPTAIDMETLFTPASDPYQGCEIHSPDEMNPVWRDMMFSAQNTLVLPMMLQGKAQISPLLRGGTETANCLPVLDGRQIPVYGYEEDFLRGFESQYDRLLLRRDELAQLVREAEEMSARFVLRASAYYALTLRELHTPSGCASSEAREKILADLNRHFEKAPEYLPVVQWERACLEEGDIPYFSFRAGHGSLYGDPRGEILMDDYFHMTATEHCFQTLEHSGPEEKRFELDYIRRRLYQGPDYSSAPQAVLPETEPLPLSADQARAEARRILGDMENMALKLTDGSRILLSADHHLVPTHHPNFERGLPGMSVFFDRAVKTAALGCEAQALRLLEDTKEDLLRSRRTYRQMSETFRAVLHPGLRKGVGGLLLSPCMDAAGIEDIIESLKLTSRSFDEENAGLYAGIGGLLLGCIAAAERVGYEGAPKSLLQLIERLNPLVIARVDKPGQVSGLGKGMSGTGLALVQSFRLTGNADCLKAAEKAFRFENAQYRKLLDGWPNYEKSSFPVIRGEGLEAGAPGIAFAAALCEETVPAAAELVDRALACTLSLPFLETDDLACGNAGIALALTAAASRRESPALLRAAGVRLARSASRAQRDGGYRSLPLRLRNVPDPSFWRGIAGIAYAMLVYADALESPTLHAYPVFYC